MPENILLSLPQENAVDIYPKVRLEAGALLLAKYLIRPRCQAAHPKHLQNASH